MDYTDVIAIVQQYVNVKAVVLAVVATQLLKYLIPSPDDGKATDTIRGHWTTRLLPVVPLVVGAAFCALIERDNAFTAEDIVRGAMSGTLAAWVYRTTKVSIFGQ